MRRMGGRWIGRRLCLVEDRGRDALFCFVLRTMLLARSLCFGKGGSERSFGSELSFMGYRPSFSDADTSRSMDCLGDLSLLLTCCCIPCPLRTYLVVLTDRNADMMRQLVVEK